MLMIERWTPLKGFFFKLQYHSHITKTTIIRLSKTRQRTTGCQVNYITKQKGEKQKKILLNVIEHKIK